MASPTTLNLDIYRGDDYSHLIEIIDNGDPPEAVPLTGYTFKAQIRERPEKSQEILAEFTVDVTQIAVGKITLNLTAASTDIPSGFWDLEVKKDGITQTWFKGTVTISGDVTRENN